MAIAQTERWVSTAPYVKLSVTQKTNNGNSVVYTYSFQYIASSAANTSRARKYKFKVGSLVKEGTYSINGKTGTNTIESGEIEIQRGTSAKTITVYCSFGFDLTWSGAYGGTKTASDPFVLAAKTSYKVSFNANGGTGGPSEQTKWHGDNLKLASGVPARSGYTFKGWATSANGAVAYAPGATYSTDANITLYAVWGSDYSKPVISNCTVERCDANKNASDSGTYAKVSFDWSCTNNVTAVGIWWHATTETTMPEKMLSASGTSGKVTNELIGGGALSVDKAYNVIVLVQDSGGSTTTIQVIGSKVYPIDFLAGGRGVAVGKPATLTDTFEVDFNSVFNKAVQFKGNITYPGWFQPSAIRLYKTASTTSLDTAYKYYNPFYGSVATDIQSGNLTYTTKTIASYGDRSNETVAGVLVGANIKRVRVSATICIQNQVSSTSLLQFTLLKVRGSTVTLEASDRFRILETEIRTMSVNTILDVTEGDFICLQGYKGVAGIDIDILATSNSVSKISQLCVEAIG